MKKTFAILLLTIHLFNIFGYRLFFSFEENAVHQQMITSLDNNKYDESELIQLKFPLNLPYMTSNRSYERCDGQVELNGIEYSYVKRTVQNDTVYLYCIPNHQQTALNDTKDEYAKQAADNPLSKKSNQSSLKQINVLSEFNSSLLSFNFNSYSVVSKKPLSFYNYTILQGFILKPLQPPDLFI